MKTYENEFTNGDITVTYQPKKCINAQLCSNGLSEVFRTSVLPWIDLDAAETNEIIDQVKSCPSGALEFCFNKTLVSTK
ncbi:(4Fe-4S)-binding protein [Candidatus Marifrigoribacter sp. Uisw_064]|uniref:(4Fe-4S)-binding protein n=1 Tax=Candidatus Marifrigoribacter sp. Uisw_064 TaxID=3230970 RepID=UPI003D56DCDF